MDRIPVFEANGRQVAEVRLPESVEICYGRRCARGQHHVFYKGAGIEYRSHLTNKPQPDERVLKSDGPIYQQYTVIKPQFVKKRGIFLWRHQPPFSDYEGLAD